MIARLFILAAALALPTSPAAAQEGQLGVLLRMVDAYGLGSDDMKADVQVATRIEAGGLTVRVRTSAGTLECVNLDFGLFPHEPAELDCLGVYPSPPLSAVSGVTAEVEPRFLPDLVEDAGRFRTLLAPPLAFRCERWTEPNALPGAFVCTMRRPD